MKADLTLIVCRSPREAVRQRATIDPNRERFMFTAPGTALMGHRFNAIIVSAAIREDIHHTMPLETRERYYERYTQWLAQIKCRLGPDGVFMEI